MFEEAGISATLLSVVSQIKSEMDLTNRICN
jgi:hypothetical protein